MEANFQFVLINTIWQRLILQQKVHKLFIDPAYYQQSEFPRKLAEYKELEVKNEELTNRWTELEEQIEALEQEFSDDD